MKKEITQEDKISKTIMEPLDEMGFIWGAVVDKLKEDSWCFKCNKPLPIMEKDDLKVPEMFLVRGNSNKGSAAILSLCVTCFNEIKKSFKEE